MKKITAVQYSDYEQEVIELEDQQDLELTSHPHQMGTDTEIRIAKEQSSVFELLRRENRGNLVLAPDFQRKNVWDRKHQSELIESVLMGIPIPLIYLFEDENGIRQIIDGKQRISALKNFINNNFQLTELSMLPELKGKIFSDIPQLLQAKIEDFQLHSYVIQPPTPEYVKFNIFERVNRGGVNLNKQEMRHALYQGKVTRLIKVLAESHEFYRSTGGGVKSERMRDRYLILRFISFYLLINGFLPNFVYRSDVDSFLAFVMKHINAQDSDYIINILYSKCLHGMKRISDCLGEDAFRFMNRSGGKKRPINMGLFEILVFVFSESKQIDAIHYEDIANMINDYKSNFDTLGVFSGSIDTTEYVKIRFEFANELIARINNAY